LDKFLAYFEDKHFVRWVLKPDNQLNEFWKNYLKNNPANKDEIELARLILLQLKSENKAGDVSDPVELLADIIKHLESAQKKRKISKIILTSLKYASIAILFFCFGAIFYYYYKPASFDAVPDQISVLSDESNARLILGNGKNIVLSQKESTIEYNDNGKIIINKKDTVLNESDSIVQEFNHLIVPYGKSSSIKLPDGTMAFLNAGSRLVYPSSFTGKRREVYLIGEGFFEVAPSEKMPFIVQVSDLNVEVLGTKFNLSAYPADNFIEAVLVEGRVSLKGKKHNLFTGDYILEPNQLAVFNRGNEELDIYNVNVVNYVSWHEGFLNFESSELNRIVKKLERYYNIRIILRDPMLGVRSITGKLILKEDKEDVLHVLANTASAELVKLNVTTYELK